MQKTALQTGPQSREVSDLVAGGFWQEGLKFLIWELEDWPVKTDLKTGRLEWEMVAKGVHLTYEPG